MGEVYRAHDTKLKRDVALKVLPEEFMTDDNRLARFQREAEVLASLNHSHIASIYGVEGVSDAQALVLELVEGPTLADRIAQGPIPIDEALPIASQIGDALEAAHDQGVIHRDLKPGNIKLLPDGSVKVLDFGLAKILDPAVDVRDGSQSPTITSPAMTRIGVVLGTAAYMSPEQARGKVVDTRSDIWAFGCVLYEMLTGARAFAGDEVSDTLAFVITKEPDWTALPAATPPSVRALLRHCLQKSVRGRLRDIGDARLAIDDALAELGAGTPVGSPIAGAPGRGRRALPWIYLPVVVLSAVGLTLLSIPRRPEPPPATPKRLVLQLPAGRRARVRGSRTGRRGSAVGRDLTGRDSYRLRRPARRPRAALPASARPIRLHGDCGHGGRLQSLLLAGRAVDRVLHEHASEEGRGLWWRPGDAMRGTQSVRSHLVGRLHLLCPGVRHGSFARTRGRWRRGGRAIGAARDSGRSVFRATTHCWYRDGRPAFTSCG